MFECFMTFSYILIFSMKKDKNELSLCFYLLNNLPYIYISVNLYINKILLLVDNFFVIFCVEKWGKVEYLVILQR